MASRFVRKRKYEEEDNYDETKKVKSYSEDAIIAEDEIESVIYKLSEKSNASIETNLENVSAFIDAKLSQNKDEIMHVLYECAAKLPEKLMVYSTLVGLVNVKNYNFIGEFVERLARNLKESLKNGQFLIAHRLIRFTSCLVNVHCITTKSLLEIYEQFLTLTNDRSSSQVRTDFYVFCILSSLPWCGKELYEKHGPQFDDLLQIIKDYIDKRQKPYMPLLKAWLSDDPHPQEEYLDCIWSQIKSLENNDWNENLITRPYKPFENMLNTAIQHEFPLITPPELNDKIIYPLPKIVFRMFDYTDVPEEFILPGAHSIERYLIEEQLNLVMDTYYTERKYCAQQLLGVNPITRLPINYMIVEVIFGQLFSLPKSPHIEVFYGSLLLELCKLQPNYMPQVLAQATELLFDRLDTMKASCIERFTAWFAYHLSNFQFRWSWEEWKSCLADGSLTTPKCKFIRETLNRCMRLSYYQRISEMLPETMKALLPAEPRPLYKYESEDAANLEGTGMANQLLEKIKQRCTPDEIVQLFREEAGGDMETETENGDAKNPLKIDVFTSTLLYFGSKSFSHIFAALAKYHMIFKILVESEESQMTVLKTLHEVWQNHQQMMVVMVDKMLKTQIVECSTIAKFVFSKEMRAEFTSFYVWEILNSTVSRMSKQVEKLQHEYDEFEERIKKSNTIFTEGGFDASDDEKLKLKQEHMESLKEAQRELFFIIIKCFTELVNDFKTNENESNDKYEYKWIIERFQDFLLINYHDLLQYLDEIRSELLSDEENIHKDVYNLLDNFTALRN